MSRFDMQGANPDFSAAIARVIAMLKSGQIKIPNRSGGANGSEIIAKIDATIGTDWKSGTGAEILAVIAAADASALTMAVTGPAPGDNTASVALIGQKDSSVGAKATLDIETEEVVAVVGTFTPSHKIAVWLNGVEYNIQLDAV